MPILNISSKKGATIGLILCLNYAIPAVAGDTLRSLVFDCRSVSSTKERLLCYDRVVDKYSVTDAKSSAANSPESIVTQESANPEELFGIPPAADGRTQIEQIGATIVEISTTASGKAAVTLDNGQVWRQTTTSTMRLSKGDKVLIRRGSLGSYKLTKDGTKRSMKVKRVL